MKEIEMLKEIWEATKDIENIKERLGNIEEKINDKWFNRGVAFLGDHEGNIESIVKIFEKDYGYKIKVSGFDLVTKLLNLHAKNIERKSIFLTGILNSVAFRLIELICIITLLILFIGQIIG